MKTVKTISILLVGLFIRTDLLFAQATNPQIGINLVPLFDRTIELNATVLRNAERELFVHAGYTAPKSYSRNQDENYYRYWEGKAKGAYLRLGGKAYLNKSGRFRMFLGTHVTGSYLNQTGKNVEVVVCIAAPCYPYKKEANQKQYLLSAGITGGFRMNLLPQVTLDVGIQANRFIFEKPSLNNEHIFVPGYGRRPVQSVASIQYVLKGR